MTESRSFARLMQACFKAIPLLLLVLMLAVGGDAWAHPEDDFCGPDAGIDPELCRQLSEAMNGTGELAAKFVDDEGNLRKPLDTAMVFADVGIKHILPGGLDHILFVLALFLASQQLRSLVIQISAFTVAHTATLGLAASGVLEPPAHIVEPLIALSIAYVAVENIYFKDMTKWRPLVVFGFGLFHGMGFAGFISEIGLPSEQFWSALIGFNVGVEVGQLSVVALAMLLSVPINRALAKSDFTYRQIVVIPVSISIGLIGLYWAVTRSLGL